MNNKLIHTYAITLSLLCGSLAAGAQNRPHTTQYVMNYFLSNPAMTGLENYADIRLGHRRQWAGINGAPVSTWATANVPLGFAPEQAPPNSLPEESSLQPRYQQPFPQRHHGLGALVYQDEIGPYKSTAFNISYAYHMPLAEKLNISAGFSTGIQRLQYDISKNLYPDDMPDPSIAKAYGSKSSPDLNAGLMLYNSRFFAGASLQQIIPAKFIDVSNSLSVYSKRWILSGGYQVKVNDDQDVRLLLSTLIKTDFTEPTTFDINAKLAMSHWWWLGASYRHKDAIAGMFGVHIAKHVNISYSYDYTTSMLNQFSNGSHELMVAFQVFKWGDGRSGAISW